MHPSGHLYTFEFNAERAKCARDNFALIGLDSIITVIHRDVVQDGFNLYQKPSQPELPFLSDKEDLPQLQSEEKSSEIEVGEIKRDNAHEGENLVKADSIFLDLPSPWAVIKSSKTILKPFGKLCSFSPCIEQVQKTCKELTSEGFLEIKTYECLCRTYDPHLCFYEPFDSATNTSTELGELIEGGETKLGKRKLEEKGEEEKKEVEKDKKQNTKRERKKKAQISKEKNCYVVVKSPMRGHSGFLTFAIRMHNQHQYN